MLFSLLALSDIDLNFYKCLCLENIVIVFVIIHIYVIYTLEDIHLIPASSFPDGVDLTITFVLKIEIDIMKSFCHQEIFFA